MTILIQEADWPQTEEDYFGIINAFGAISWRYEHDVCDGRQEASAEMDQWQKDAAETAWKLWDEIAEKFGVVHPNDVPKYEFGVERPPAPEGKLYPQDWTSKIQNQIDVHNWANCICSACPYGDLKKIDYRPCSRSGGSNRLPGAECAIEELGEWARERFLPHTTIAEVIKAEHGTKALRKFLKKQRELHVDLDRYFFWASVAYRFDSERKSSDRCYYTFDKISEAASKAGEEYKLLLEDVQLALRDTDKCREFAVQALAAIDEIKPRLNMYYVQNFSQVRGILKGICDQVPAEA